MSDLLSYLLEKLFLKNLKETYVRVILIPKISIGPEVLSKIMLIAFLGKCDILPLHLTTKLNWKKRR